MITLSNQETARYMVRLGETKGNTPVKKALLRGFMGGVFIGIGFIGFHVVTTSLSGDFGAGLVRLIGALVFPVGLMLVLLVGGDLFTGNSLSVLATLDKRLKVRSLLRSLALVWVGNLMGTIFIAAIAILAGMYDRAGMADLALTMAVSKANLDFGQTVFSAFLCNILVASAIWMSASCRDGAGKILAIWFPIMVFVLCGYQHIVANMYILSLSYMLGSTLSVALALKALIGDTLGNSLSGGILLPLIYHYLFVKKSSEISPTDQQA